MNGKGELLEPERLAQFEKFKDENCIADETCYPSCYSCKLLDQSLLEELSK